MSRVARWFCVVWLAFAGSALGQSASDEVVPKQAVQNQPDAATPSWQPDVWHHVQPDSPFFTEDRRDMHSAGLVQSDGQFALLVLGTAQQGGLISVNLPGETPARELMSDLVMPAGNVLSRTVTEDQLLASPTLDGASHTYSFRIAPEDVRLFKGAMRWRIKAGDQSLTLTLKGSKKAIARAMAARDSTDDTDTGGNDADSNGAD